MNSLFKENIQMINSPERELFWAVDVFNRNGIEYAYKDPATGKLVGELAQYIKEPKVVIKTFIYDLIKDLNIGDVATTPESMNISRGSCTGSVAKIVSEQLKGRKFKTISMDNGQTCFLRVK